MNKVDNFQLVCSLSDLENVFRILLTGLISQFSGAVLDPASRGVGWIQLNPPSPSPAVVFITV